MPGNEQQNISTGDEASLATPGLLLVDDDPLILEGLGFILRKQYNLITAESRHQAMERE